MAYTPTRLAVDINQGFGIALVGGYRFFGRHDGFQVTVAEEDDEDGLNQELPESIVGGLGPLDSSGFGASFELYFRFAQGDG